MPPLAEVVDSSDDEDEDEDESDDEDDDDDDDDPAARDDADGGVAPAVKSEEELLLALEKFYEEEEELYKESEAAGGRRLRSRAGQKLHAPKRFRANRPPVGCGHNACAHATATSGRPKTVSILTVEYDETLGSDDALSATVGRLKMRGAGSKKTKRVGLAVSRQRSPRARAL